MPRLLLVTLAAALVPTVSPAQEACPRASGADAEAGWEAYRAGDLARSRARFQAALTRCPDDLYAVTGLGYVALRDGDDDEARGLFGRVVEQRPDDVDALVGLGLVAWRSGDRRGAGLRFARVFELAPDHPTAVEYLARLRSGEPTLPPGPEDPADEAWRAGDTQRALGLYRARLDADPQDRVALRRVAMMLAWDGSYAEARSLLDRLAALAPEDLEVRVDRARVQAWQGDLTGALEMLDEVLARAPGFPPALEARATFEAWSGRYQESLSTYDQLLGIAPDNAAARRQQAQVLGWAERFEASRAVYDSLLAADPSDLEARLGLGRALTFGGELEGAMDAYREVLRRDPLNVRAFQGLGRALSWSGRLVEGEDAFRQGIRADAGDVATLVGLAQNLRWQGRNAAALEVLEAARALDPADADVREQRRWVDVALGTQLRPTVVLERDSDDNRMLTASLMASWHPVPRMTLRADAYRRALDWTSLSRWANGLTVSGSWQAEPGWTVSAGVGGSRTDGSGTSSFTAWTVGLGSPGRYPATASLSVTSSALDATALLAERGIRVTDVAGSARWTPTPRWRVEGTAARAVFDGSEANHRTSLGLSASRGLGATWTLGGGVRGFAFEKDLADGYFDPDFYGIAEVTGRWLAEPGRWSLLLEVAPGLQQVTRDGDPAGAFRTSARVALRVGPGRELSLAGGYSSTGLQSFATGASDYRYTAVILGASWVF